MEGLIRHYDMLAGIDGHRVRWTPNGRPDAWPTDFYYDFAFKPLALASFAQSLIVLCEDAIYRIDGNVATDLSLSKTRAENGCIAAGSVQKTHAGLVYLSNMGLMVFDGMDARPLTASKIPGQMFLGTSNPTSIGFPIYPSQFSYNYAYLTMKDGIKGSMENALTNAPTNPVEGPIKAIGSFYVDGKYILYWKAGYTNYVANTGICVDLQSPGMPITTLSMKIRDAFVDSNEQAYVLLDGAPAPTYVEITAP